MARHLAPASKVRISRESYAATFPRAAVAFDDDRRAHGRGKRAA